LRTFGRKSEDHNLEVWFFNVERLKLSVMRLDGSSLQADHLVPKNVWTRTSEGIFERQRVVEEVDDWFHRVECLYSNVRDWVDDNKQLRLEETRTVTMSEEIMQAFAVGDRELPVVRGWLGRPAPRSPFHDDVARSQVIGRWVPRCASRQRRG
jgi:hypothetical protein